MGIDDINEQIAPLDRRAMASARQRQSALTKPAGSLGRLEELSIRLAGIYRGATPKIGRKVIVVAAGDHGVTEEGVSSYPSEVTGQMVLNFLGGGAAINVLARSVGAEVVIVDAGVKARLPANGNLRSLRIGPGTRNMTKGTAMTRAQALRCLEAGMSLAEELVAEGASLLGTGDMGIGNTTSASAITSVMTGSPPEAVTGRGTGISDEARRHKAEVVSRALRVNRPDLEVLSKVGGFEVGMLAGIVLGGAKCGKPVVLDGFISGASALIACGVAPRAREYLIASHRSVEPGHGKQLVRLKLRPLLDMRMRLGEGTGAALAMPVIEGAARCLVEMATFDSAGVSGRAG
jgi:nicotinate-nucleotide--dimethylbenzimidazole phosphoribosyltransferase